MIRARHALCALLLGATAVAPATALAASTDTYPDRPIRLIVGYSAAGAADLIARVFGEGLGKHLGQPVVVENRPGAGSTLSTRAVVAAPADGYTLALASATVYGIDQFLYNVDYTAKDFTPLMRLTVSPLVLAVNTGLGVESVGQLAERLKAHPGTMNYSSSGIGGSPHVAGAMFEQAVGSKATHVPFKGGAPALQAVAAGHVQFSFGTASSVLPLAQQGSVRMLGVSTKAPSKVVPDLKPLAAQGLEDFDYSFWFALIGPAGLPAEIQKRLVEATQKTLADPDIQARLLATGNEAAPMASQAEFASWAQEYGEFVLERVKKAGITLQ